MNSPWRDVSFLTLWSWNIVAAQSLQAKQFYQMAHRTKTKFFPLIQRTIYFKLYKISNVLCWKFVAIALNILLSHKRLKHRNCIVMLDWTLCYTNRSVCQEPQTHNGIKESWNKPCQKWDSRTGWRIHTLAGVDSHTHCTGSFNSTSGLLTLPPLSPAGIRKPGH